MVARWKIGVIATETKVFNPYADADVPSPDPLPRCPDVPASWRLRLQRPQRTHDDQDPPQPLSTPFGAMWKLGAQGSLADDRLSVWVDLGITQGAYTAFLVYMPQEAVSFYKPLIINNAFFWATLEEMKARKRGDPRRAARNQAWQNRADALLALWDAHPYRSQIQIYDSIAGFDMQAEADATTPEDLE